MKNNIQIPSVFSLIRGVEVSDAVIDGVKIFEHGGVTVKSHLSNEETNNDVYNVNNAMNLFYGEVAKTITDKVTVVFSLKLNQFGKSLYQTNDVEFYKSFNEKISLKNEKIEKAVKKISSYFAFNILSGRWLWRNKLTADKIGISVNNNVKLDDIIHFDNNIKLNENNEIINGLSEKEKEMLNQLSDKIFKGFQNGETVLNIKAELNTREYMNFYPSEIYNPAPRKIGKLTFSKEYYKTPDTHKPALTFEKVWNALRTFDVWYKDYENVKEPISIEFKGGNIKFQKLFRNSKDDFRIYLKKFMADEEMNENELLYFTACIIRGGIIADEKSEKAKK